MNNNLSSIKTEAVNVAQQAAIACFDWIGRGKEKLADQAAVNAMRESLNKMQISGKIVIGEGERDEAPMLYIGEEVGLGGLEVDIALDPLEGTTICANAGANSLAVIAFAQRGNFLHAPDVYMDKIAVGGNLPNGVVDLDNSVKTNLTNLAKAKKCAISDLRVMILQRERHEKIIADCREAGAQVQLIGDGDVAAVIATTDPQTGIDMYMGIGGAPEGVLAAAALRTVSGQFMGRLIFNDNQRQIQRAKDMGITDLNKKYVTEEMASGDVLFIASGVTDGSMLDGVKKNNSFIKTHSLIMDSAQKQINKIQSQFIL
ncbi:MAG: class II fructose-bisphosphatase [Proteobacteria bacterium]|nr:class II fructose-bisphosphatase [Pseudomonadota bacterium]